VVAKILGGVFGGKATPELSDDEPTGRVSSMGTRAGEQVGLRKSRSSNTGEGKQEGSLDRRQIYSETESWGYARKKNNG